MTAAPATALQRPAGAVSSRAAGVLLVALCLGTACSRDPAAPPVAPAAAPTPGPRLPRAPRADVAPRPAADAPARLESLAAADDTFQSLVARYGRDAVVRATLPGAEGAEVDGWVLFPNDATRRVEVYPDEAGRHPGMLIARDGATWTRADGVRAGLDTRALQALNGRPFAFSGFDWDYGGYVTDWNGGHLAHGGRFIGPVRLCAPGSTPPGYPEGDGEFMSDAEAVRAAPPVVCEVGLALGQRAD